MKGGLLLLALVALVAAQSLNIDKATFDRAIDDVAKKMGSVDMTNLKKRVERSGHSVEGKDVKLDSTTIALMKSDGLLETKEKKVVSEKKEDDKKEETEVDKKIKEEEEKLEKKEEQKEEEQKEVEKEEKKEEEKKEDSESDEKLAKELKEEREMAEKVLNKEKKEEKEKKEKEMSPADRNAEIEKEFKEKQKKDEEQLAKTMDAVVDNTEKEKEAEKKRIEAITLPYGKYTWYRRGGSEFVLEVIKPTNRYLKFRVAAVIKIPGRRSYSAEYSGEGFFTSELAYNRRGTLALSSECRISFQVSENFKKLDVTHTGNNCMKGVDGRFWDVDSYKELNAVEPASRSADASILSVAPLMLLALIFFVVF